MREVITYIIYTHIVSFCILIRRKMKISKFGN